MPKKSNCKLSPHLCATQGLSNAQPIQLLPNGDMYETLGIEGLVPIHRHERRYRADSLIYPLKPQSFIYDAVRFYFCISGSGSPILARKLENR